MTKINQPQQDKRYPNTLLAQEAGNASGRPRIFEPALKQFSDAFQLGDYESTTEHEWLEWVRVRAEVRTHLLRLIECSRWQEHLVLRGSVLMQAWFGELARDPKDIDWVFQPSTVKSNDQLAIDCLNELVELVHQYPRTPNAEIILSRIAQDEIWTYERAEGRRLIFPFQTADGHTREVQMDIVWNEPLLQAPVLTTLPTQDSSNRQLRLWTATPELSLAWKLLWLASDFYPQGKDFYDAILLAEKLPVERVPLSYDLLCGVCANDEWLGRRHLTPDLFTNFRIDWQQFRNSFPQIAVDVEDWEKRLSVALAPTFIEGTVSTVLKRVDSSAPPCLPAASEPKQ